MYKIKLEKFEGPLDLLLQLIKNQELEITEVSLAQVTDQYIEYIHTAAAINPEEIADFLLVAAKLLYLKSREIIPDAIWEEDDDVDLEEQLKIYQEYYEASLVIDKMAKQENFVYTRHTPMTKQVDVGFYPPDELQTSTMKQIFENVLQKLEPIIKVPKTVIDRTITITEKIGQIREIIQQKLSTSFKNLLHQGNKADVILSFLALLELVKQKQIYVDQSSPFTDITIKKAEN